MTGYVLLPELFEATEVARLRDAAEQVHAAVIGAAEAGETRVTVWPDGHRLEEIGGTTIHWEPDAPGKAVRSLAPVSQLHPAFGALWDEPRLTGPIEAPAGSVLIFPGLMVHRSAPNRTADDRRSLLFCFQPLGRPELSALLFNPERLADLP